MALSLTIGPLTSRIAQNDDDVLRCQALRHTAFFGRDGVDKDAFDADFSHVLIENGSGDLLATLRYRILADGADLDQTYTGQFYDICGLHGPLIEIGRFCLQNNAPAADILRLAMATMTRVVDANAISYLFGCSSFAGIDPAPYCDAFSLLTGRFALSSDVKITPKAVEYIDLPSDTFEMKVAQETMPPLLRSYIGIGGKTGAYAVIDRDLQTLHVFTAVEIAAIPQSRAAALRALTQISGLHPSAPRNS